MLKNLKRLLASIICLSLVFITPAPMVHATNSGDSTELNQFRQDLVTFYWNQLDEQAPWVTEFAFGDLGAQEFPWKVSANDPLIDADPFFMRSQSWSTNSETDRDLQFAVDGKGLKLAIQGKTLDLQQPLKPILETDEYIVMVATDRAIFEAKAPGESESGEGFFFINKKDLVRGVRTEFPVPVFHFPLPGSGWVNSSRASFEFEVTNQIILHTTENEALPIDLNDVALLERLQRDNLILSQVWSFFAGEVQQNGVALPYRGSTIAFGLMLSGHIPEMVANGVGFNWQSKIRQIANLVIPQAQAEEKTEQTASWKKWILPAVLYGGTAVLAGMAYQHVDWSQLIPTGMGKRIATVSSILGGVLVASVAMKYSIHREHFRKKYPKVEGESWLSRLNKEHKGILDELTHGLYFSMAAIPQGIRHVLEFLKDRYQPQNKWLHTAWEATMGYQMRQNSHLAMNWKTFYLGALVFGMADSALVAVDLLIFAPYLVTYFGLGAQIGAATAQFASSEVLRNFLGYLQGGAHSYSAEVKMIHLMSAEREAKRQLVAQGKDPEAAKNEPLVRKLAENELERRYKTVGLPGQDEFIYDPITVLESISRNAGFDSPKAVKDLPAHQFVLSKRHWGYIKPALKKALKRAQLAQAKAPSEVGAQTVKTLEWALNERSSVKAIAGRVWDVAASRWAKDEMKEAIDSSVVDWLSTTSTPTWMGAMTSAVKGGLKYLTRDSTKDVRDIRQVLFLASTTGDTKEVLPYMPESWRSKAGSDDAAVLSAELFHRAFFSFFEGDKFMIDPSPEMETRFSAKANRILDKVAQSDISLRDPFVRQTRYWELLHRLKRRADRRDAVRTYTPAKLSRLGVRQWSRARELAEAVMSQNGWDTANEEEWSEMATTFGNKIGKDIDRQAWIQSHRYRFVVAQKFAQQTGLVVSDVGDSKFVQKVMITASEITESQLKTSEERSYRETLTAVDREFHKARVFTDNFVQTYINMAVHEYDELPPSSGEYPGLFQKLRKKLVGIKGGKAIGVGLRSIEALFRNEDTSYRAGWWSFLDRNLPLFPDMYHNFVRTLRVMPFFLTISYLTSYYIWQIHMPYAMWVAFMLFGFTGPALVEFNNRLQKNWGKKPMSDVPNKLTYSWIHSRLTNPEAMLMQTYAQPITDTFEKYVSSPVRNIASDCADFLTRKGR